jgi:hypothetical protein
MTEQPFDVHATRLFVLVAGDDAGEDFLHSASRMTTITTELKFDGPGPPRKNNKGQLKSSWPLKCPVEIPSGFLGRSLGLNGFNAGDAPAQSAKIGGSVQPLGGRLEPQMEQLLLSFLQRELQLLIRHFT